MEKLRTGETTPFRRRFRKLLMIMRLLFALIFLTLMQVSASTYSQNTRLSLKLENAGFTELFSRIKQQSEFTFVYNVDDVERLGNISCEFQESTVEQILDQCLKSTGMTYEVRDKVVVLAPRETLAINKRPVDTGQPQVRTVSGTVTDTGGQPLPGVSVVVKGTTTGTVTDASGEFSLRIPIDAEILQFSFVGMKSQEISVEGKTVFSVILEEETIGLEEVVAVGYGVQRKANLTGAVDQITSETFENRTMTNLTQGLQGVMPNVNIRLLDGKPNQAPQINIRGTTSIGQGGQALILIDGVEGDPSMINPNDIESISVLKDAASSAIYGARGAFGVVLINTKQPTKDDFSITYGLNIGIKMPTAEPNLVTDGYTWASMYNEAHYNWEGTHPQSVNKTLPFSQEYLAELKRRSENPDLPKTEIGPDGQYVYYHNTDWYDLLYKDHLQMTEHNLSMSGSTDKVNFMISGRYLDQDGLFRYNSDDYRMYNLRAKGTVDIFPWLQVSNNFDFSKRSYFNPVTVGEGETVSIWQMIALEAHPMAPLLNPDGTLTHSAAYTVGDYYYGKNGFDLQTNRVKNTTGFASQFFDNSVRILGDFTFQNSNSHEIRKRVPVPYSKAPEVVEYLGLSYNDLRSNRLESNYLATNLYGEYEKRHDEKHYVKATVGINYEESTSKRIVAERNGLIFEDAQDLNLALGQAINVSGGYNKWRIFGGFYRLNYIFSDKYLLELNGRYDGSSKFPEDERYAFFPSVSLGWRISEEPFWNVSDNFISDLKLRASYGSLGNGNIGSYAFLETFSISQTSRILQGTQPQITRNPAVLPDGLTWETSTTRNIGLDLGMVSGKLQFTGDVYVRKTTDMYTIGVTLPATFGATAPRGNYADLKTNGWEAMLSWRDQFRLNKKPLNYNIRLTLSDYRAEILKYNNPDMFLTDYYEGMVLGEIWGYVTEGFFSSQEEIDNHADQSRFNSTSWGEIFPGDIKLKDVNNDGAIDPGDNTLNDPGDQVVIGNTTPRYTFGINLGADWNNFFFSAFFQGVGKQDWYPSTEANLFWGQYNRPYGDIPKWHLKDGIIWSEDNPDSFFPRYVARVANRSGAILTSPQTGYVMNAAYIRLKNLQFGYNVPGNLISRFGMQAAKMYVSMDNVWIWSPMYKIVDDVDVENITAPADRFLHSTRVADGFNYPMLKNFSFGLSVTF